MGMEINRRLKVVRICAEILFISTLNDLMQRVYNKKNDFNFNESIFSKNDVCFEKNMSIS